MTFFFKPFIIRLGVSEAKQGLCPCTWLVKDFLFHVQSLFSPQTIYCSTKFSFYDDAWFLTILACVLTFKMSLIV